MPALTVIPAPQTPWPTCATLASSPPPSAWKAGLGDGFVCRPPHGHQPAFDGQPVQGHSGIKRMADGSFWLLTDNGAGSKANSPDFMLHLSHYTGGLPKRPVQPPKTVFLHDPDKKVPFRITQEGTDKRYLTGADFDPRASSSPVARCGLRKSLAPTSSRPT